MTSISSRKRVLLDSNLLLLIILGSLDRSLIGRFKRLQAFSVRDYDELADIVSRAETLVTTPHLLTEVSNLANSLRDDLKDDFARRFLSWIEILQEQHTPATILGRTPEFRFGIADASMLHAGTPLLILTQDGRFAAQVAAPHIAVADLATAAALGPELLRL